MPRFRLPHSRGNVRGLKKEEEGKVSLFYSEPIFRRTTEASAEACVRLIVQLIYQF